MAVDWTPERINTLIALWEEGLPTSEIGRRLDVTKNAVVGKVHRLGLPKRNSPIKGAQTQQAAKPAPASAPAPTPVEKAEEPVAEVAAAPAPKKAPAKPKKDVIHMENLRPGMCCWPEGEPGKDDFHFCGQPSVPEKPYCAEHCERAYVRSTKDRKPSTVAA